MKLSQCKDLYVRYMYSWGVENGVLLSDVKLHELNRNLTERLIKQAEEYCQNCKY